MIPYLMAVAPSQAALIPVEPEAYVAEVRTASLVIVGGVVAESLTHFNQAQAFDDFEIEARTVLTHPETSGTSFGHAQLRSQRTPNTLILTTYGHTAGGDEFEPFLPGRADLEYLLRFEVDRPETGTLFVMTPRSIFTSESSYLIELTSLNAAGEIESILFRDTEQGDNLRRQQFRVEAALEPNTTYQLHWVVNAFSESIDVQEFDSSLILTVPEPSLIPLMATALVALLYSRGSWALTAPWWLVIRSAEVR